MTGLEVEQKRCIHDMVKGTCSLCAGYPQAGSLRGGKANPPAYIHENFFYKLCCGTGSLATGKDAGHDPNWDE